jgi:hypothetical protein
LSNNYFAAPEFYNKDMDESTREIALQWYAQNKAPSFHIYSPMGDF